MPNDIEKRVVYEDNHLIIVNKRCGELSQGDESGDPTLADAIKAYLKEKYHKPGNVFLGIVHRLDRPTSGLSLYAKTDKALGRLNEAFRDGEAKKTYWAIVDGLPPKSEDTLVHYIVRNSETNKSVAFKKEVKGSKKAVLKYRLLASSHRYHLLEIELLTGRHHQIRAQLKTLGLHIKGDLKYGFPRSNPDKGICLHARKLSLVHPVRKEEMTFIAPPPQDALWDYFVTHLPPRGEEADQGI